MENRNKYFAFNISNEEQNALQNVMNNPDVILKWTDKGSSLDFMDKIILSRLFGY